ncbi:MAG: helicase RepA family protein [Epibacterium sp.]|nr:helicase RepA family protein [Epibacterium sp.]NQX73915.1 AAA family ATPase [Epibacterium sp.]
MTTYSDDMRDDELPENLRAAVAAWFKREAADEFEADLDEPDESAPPDNVHNLRRLPTPFVWIDPAQLPRRQWIMGHHLIRKQVSVTLAPGGLGKSSMIVAEALAMASGKQILGDWVERGLRVWLWNLEDEMEELTRRILAAMQHHRITADDIKNRLFVDSGRKRELVTAVMLRGQMILQEAVYDEIADEIKAMGIDVLTIDPFISSHQADENSNPQIDQIVKRWAKLADQCNIAVELVHHTRKLGGADASSESARGASSLLGAARSARVLNRMDPDLAEKWNCAGDGHTYFGVDRDKANLAPAEKRIWRRVTGVDLPNGDQVGVVEAWDPPNAFDGLTEADLTSVQSAMRDDPDQCRKDPRSPAWIGHLIGDVLDINMDDPAGKQRVKDLIRGWAESGAIKLTTVTDNDHKKREIYTT